MKKNKVISEILKLKSQPYSIENKLKIQKLQQKLIMTEEDIKYRQGRSKYRVEQTEKVAGYGLLICFGIILLLFLFK